MCVGTMLVLWLAVSAAAAQSIEVRRERVSFEQTNSLILNNSVEYILDFEASSEQAMWPTRLSLSAEGAGPARPVIVTARQPSGAQTWQLPFQPPSSPLLADLQRTLCFNTTEQGPDIGVGGELTLHVSTASAESVRLSARADPARDWLLQFHTTHDIQVTPSASAVHFYRWPEEQQSVRLVLSSGDDVCSLVAVQNYSCPVAQTEEQVEQGDGMRMTVQRSGAAFIARSRFPRGFYVVALVLESDEPCAGAAPAPEPDWLWEAALTDDDAATSPRPATDRTKHFRISFSATLTRGQYWLAASLTLLVFLVFYAAFLALVFAQRIPAFKGIVGPRAVLAKPADAAGTEAGQRAEDANRRWRRDSNATLDSVDDNSESDEESERPPARPAGPATVRTEASDVSTPPASPVSDSPPPGAPAAPVTPTPAPVTPPPAFADLTPPPSFADVAARAEIERVDDDNRISVQPNGIQTGTSNTNAIENADSMRNAGATEGPQSGADEAVGRSAPPFGLPPRLTLAALSRRRARTLRARSDRYLHTLYTVAVFYALPVIQFVAAFQILLLVSGSLDLCYYNFLCAHPWGGVSDFNHVFSNLGYLLLGALFMLQLRRRRLRRTRKPKDEEYGIPAHYGLLTSLGAAMMVVALLSACYHICPNGLNFQFDTSFMYVLAVLVMVKLYQARHPDINARAHATFAVLAVLIALVVWGVLGGGGLFWGVFTVLHVFTFLLLSLRIYYLNQFRIEGSTLAAAAAAARGLRRLPAHPPRPLYRTRLLLLTIANSLNWAFAFYGLYSQPADFATHLLYVLLGNALLYMVFYVTMKLRHGERLRWYAWLFTAAAALCWAPALYFFTAGSSSWSATPALSRHRNHECRVLQFYDSHDLWHMLSAAALYFTFNALLTWDDGLSDVKRTDIAVF